MSAPSTPLLDNFNRADGAPGSNWEQLISAYSLPNIVSDALDWPQYPSAGWVTSCTAKQEAWAKVNSTDPTAATGVYLALRMANPDSGNESGYICAIDPSFGGLGDAAIQRFDSGSTTLIEYSNYVTPGIDQTFFYVWATAINDLITVYSSPDFVSWTQCLQATDSTYSGGGMIGMFHPNNGTPGSIAQFGGGSIVLGLVVTNQTNEDFSLGPLRLPGGVGQTLVLDDTSDTALYLVDDDFADELNTLVQSGMVTVSDAASPFPRPTGAPAVVHGNGSPQGKRYAAQGSLYLRRDNTGGSSALLTKTTGVTFDTGWAALADPWSGANQALGLQASTFPVQLANGHGSPTSGQALACGVWLDAGSVLTGLVVNYVAAASSLTHAYLGVYNASCELQAVTADAHSSFGSLGWIELAFMSGGTAVPYVVPSSGLYYFALLFVGTTPPSITYISGAGAQASQANTSGQVPYFEGTGTSDTTLLATASPTLTTKVPWIGAY